MNKPRKPKRNGTTRAIGYIRVSTRAQAESGAGLENQRQAVTAEIQRRGWTLVEIIADEGESGTRKPDSRPGLGRALKMLDEGDEDILCALKVDRVSRSTLDLAKLVERADDRGWQLSTMDVGLDPATPTGEAMRSMLAVFARLEARFISERTKEALAIKKEQGVAVGVRKNDHNDPEVVDTIRLLRAQGLSWPRIATTLNESSTPTFQSRGVWHPMTCKRLAEKVSS